jgi:hypothetical protein
MARMLAKKEWHPLLGLFSEVLVGKRAEVEVDSLDLGAQLEAEWVPLLGLSYDPKNDLIEVALEGLDHAIRKPRVIQIEDGKGPLESLEITDADNVRHIVKLKDPLLLPAPRH